MADSRRHKSQLGLNYMPATFARRLPGWAPFALFGVLAAVVLVVIGRATSPSLFVGVGFLLVTAGCAALSIYCACAKRDWSYRIEGRTLAFRRPWDNGWGIVQLDELSEVLKIQEETGDFYELVFSDGRRTRLQFPLFEPWRKFIAAIQKVRPEIQLGFGRSGSCGVCGQAINSLRPACEECGAAIPTRFPAIKEAGVMLPDSLGE